MKEIRSFKSEEILRASANLDRIEFMVGHPVDATLLDIDTLSKKRLNSNELNTIATNINRVEFMRKKSPKISFSGMTIIGKIIEIIKIAFGVSIILYILYGILFVF